MFGFFKKLMGKGEPESHPVATPTAAPAAPVPSPPRPAVPVVPATASPPAPPPLAPSASKVVMPQTGSRPAPVVAAPAPSAPQAGPPPADAAPANFSGATLDLPLRPLWPKLNPAVTQTATGHPDGKAQLKLPLELVQPMLARGAVKIPYGTLRQFAPDGLFPALPGKETLEVEIPLSEVLARVKPEQMARRAQKKIEVPEDIGPIFGAGGAELRVADAKPKAPEPAPKNEATRAVPSVTSVPEPPKAPAPVPLPAPTPPVKPISPTATAPGPTIAPTTPPPPAEPVPIVNEPIRAPKLDPSLASLKPKPSVPTPSPAAAESKAAVFVLPLVNVTPVWTAAGKKELAGLSQASLEIPTSILESALKTGKLAFPWRVFRTWITPATGLPNLSDDQYVELPLALVAPKFMAQRAIATPKKRVQVSDEIPDLFAQKSAATSPAAPTTEAAPPHAVPGVSRPALEFGEIFGQAEKKSWTFPEVTQKTASLRGVAGALIATSDGLLIAGTWPAGVKPESVAAFIPQMYSRMVQCTKELKLGEPGNFTLLIENVPVQIFKTSGNYFAVLGRAGENLPKAQLTALAIRLAMTQPAK